MYQTIKKIFNGQIQGITSAAAVIALMGLISRLLGLFRDRVLAGEFGAGDILDAYYAAFRIPDLVFNLLVLGALSAGFIPVFTSYLCKTETFGEKCEKEHLEAWKLANGVLNILFVGLIILCGILILISPWLIKLITPGFSAEKMAITVKLTQIMFLSPILLGLSSVFGSILQTFKRFFVYSLAPIFYNIGIIIGALFFVKWWGIRGLAVGVVFGALMHLLIQIPTAIMIGYRFQFYLSFVHEGVIKIAKMMVPRTLGLAVSQINLVIITAFASLLPQGSLTVFNLANNLQSFPVGLFGISYALAAFPTLSEYVALKKNEDFMRVFSRTAKEILFFIIPISVLFILLRAQIVRVVLGTGNFDWQDTIETAAALGFFSLSLFAQGLIPLLAKSFYANQDTKTPFWAALISMVLNAVLAYLLMKPWGVGGLALAFSISSLVNLLILLIWLKKKIVGLERIFFSKSFGKVIVASAVLGIVTQAGKYAIAPLVNMQTFVGIFLQGLGAGLFGLLAFVLISYILKSEELFSFISAFKRKFYQVFKTKFLIKEGLDGLKT